MRVVVYVGVVCCWCRRMVVVCVCHHSWVGGLWMPCNGGGRASIIVRGGKQWVGVGVEFRAPGWEGTRGGAGACGPVCVEGQAGAPVGPPGR